MKKELILATLIALSYSTAYAKDVDMRIRFILSEAKAFSDVRFISGSITCPNNGYHIKKILPLISTLDNYRKDVTITINGSFDKENCDMLSNGDKKDVYFTLENFAVEYTYNGSKHRCNFDNQTFGTYGNISPNKIEATYEKKPIYCDDGVNDDSTYKIEGGSFAKEGIILITVKEFRK